MGYEKQCEVIFDQMNVPKEKALGHVGRAGHLLEDLEERAAVAKCAEMVGAMQTAFHMTVAYAKERE